MTRPRRPGTADPGSDPAEEWGRCWICGHVHRHRDCDSHDWASSAN